MQLRKVDICYSKFSSNTEDTAASGLEVVCMLRPSMDDSSLRAAVYVFSAVRLEMRIRPFPLTLESRYTFSLHCILILCLLDHSSAIGS